MTSRHQRRNILNAWQHTNTRVLVQRHTYLHTQKSRTHVLQGRTTSMDCCSGTKVFMVHFLVDLDKWTWTDSYIYMRQDSRVVQTAAKTPSSTTTEGSLQPSFWLPNPKGGRDYLHFLESFRWREYVWHKVLTISKAFNSYMSKLVRVSQHLQSEFMREGSKSMREKFIHEQKRSQ